MIKAIFFDIHKVITQGDFRDIYRGFAKRTLIPLEKVVDYHEQNLGGLLLGSISSDQMLTDFGLEDTMTLKEMIDVWTEETVKNMVVDAEMTGLLKELRKSYRLAALTNLTEQRLGADMRMGLYDYFDYKVLSCGEGVKKPDREFFIRALEIVEVKPKEVIFVDDQLKNIKAAEELGIKSIQFTDYRSFKQELVSLGIV
ncbi:MAG: HAD family phosphatase [Candidatus Paceibacterota bacterium]